MIFKMTYMILYIVVLTRNNFKMILNHHNSISHAHTILLRHSGILGVAWPPTVFYFSSKNGSTNHNETFSINVPAKLGWAEVWSNSTKSSNPMNPKLHPCLLKYIGSVVVFWFFEKYSFDQKLPCLLHTNKPCGRYHVHRIPRLTCAKSGRLNLHPS